MITTVSRFHLLAISTSLMHLKSTDKFWAEVELPVYSPEYAMVDLKLFQESLMRNSWDLVLLAKRWLSRRARNLSVCLACGGLNKENTQSADPITSLQTRLYLRSTRTESSNNSSFSLSVSPALSFCPATGTQHTLPHVLFLDKRL